MMADPIIRDAIAAAFGFTTGFVIGVTHFASLRWNARVFVNGSAARAVAVALARIVGAAGALATLMLLSPFAALAGGIGFLAARLLMLRRSGEQT
jgi:F1-F0 ATPase (N-ATPase) AtpR subunit